MFHMHQGVTSRLLCGAAATPPGILSGATSRAKAGHPLQDSFSRMHTYLRVSLTERCNLRCTYCMPEGGVELTPNQALLTPQETRRLIRLFTSAGVTKVRFTGGEPLLSADLVDLVRFTRQECGVREIAITTNGILLSRHLDSLREAGLTSINISLDTLREDAYTAITRRNGLRKVLAALSLVERNAPELTLKLNCVVMRGVNTEELGSFVALTRDKKIDVRFIEYMPFADNKWERGRVVSFMECMDHIEQQCGARLEPVSLTEARSSISAGGVAKLFRLPSHLGRVGFITTVTLPFCSTCNRLRLTADGKLMVCLFEPQGVSLLDEMRAGVSDAQLLDVVHTAVLGKYPSLAGKGSCEELAGDTSGGGSRPMVRIGG